MPYNWLVYQERELVDFLPVAARRVGPAGLDGYVTRLIGVLGSDYDYLSHACPEDVKAHKEEFDALTKEFYLRFSEVDLVAAEVAYIWANPGDFFFD